jgi:hypothetical protein
MATIQQQIEVAAEPPLVASSWGRFLRWARTGPGRLVCDELACVDAVRSGFIDFIPTANGRTMVICHVERPDAGPAPKELQHRLAHDLVMFKDYVERSGTAKREINETERAAFKIESGRRGDAPRHTRVSNEAETTFWRSHFPT